ncbi:TfoX/Sxy family protein [Pelagibacterium halotolerans]|uniref:TfoX/Sxy family protein n=1 Tax=Pelagibacterium halotolerans TaxID=531813 RepID=UPI00384D9330
MAYDEDLTARFRDKIDGLAGISEKRMMGGICFFLNGHMIGGADKAKTGERRFMFRVGKDNEQAAEALPGGEALIQGGRKMTGFYFVDADGLSDAIFTQWLSLAIENALSLPEK